LAYWKELEGTQFLPEEVLRERQWQSLEKILHYVYHNNPYYRRCFDRAGIQPKDIHSAEDFSRFPILTKQLIRQNANELISDDFCRQDLMQFKTGGSTGTSLVLYITEECSEQRNACARRYDRWTGWEPGEPVGAVWGNPEIPRGMVSKLKEWLLNPMIYLDTMSVSDEAVKRFAHQWRKVKPTLLFGHAHSLYILAEYAERIGIDVINPKGILSTSMMLLPHERQKIEQVFGVKVTDRYGCEEVSLIACECECHNGMHLNIENLYVEFINDDGAKTQPGQMGKIIVTDLMNKAMPFIRYQVEDMGVPSNRKCPCGRGLPLMENVVGRLADFLLRRDGSQVAGVSLIENTLTRIPGIEQMQIIQEALEHFVIKLVVGESFTQSALAGLLAYFKRQFGQESEFEIVYVDSIPPDSSGKYRFSICRLPHG